MWRFIVPLENEGEPEFWKGESKKINFLLYNYMKVHKFSTLFSSKCYCERHQMR